ncbi:hypothetical protein CBNA_1168 [Coxiella burnetii str. Namibia]|nr:hypothetical protein CBNA_1168 [Coxiella burnetii str. Namibia]
MLWPLVGIYKRIPATEEALCVSFLEIITIVCNYLFATDGFTSLRCRLDMRLGFQDPRRSLVAPPNFTLYYNPVASRSKCSIFCPE